jgi:membrane protein YqaA with SNARE-associated domain
MHEALAHYGYPALFLVSFLASTLIPLGSEWLLVTLVLQKHDPLATVAVATAGNYLGACTSYLLGIYGGTMLIEKVLRIGKPERERAERLFARYGSWTLLFSWLPVVGDPLCLAGGLLKVDFVRFSTLVAAGKLARYATVAWLTIATVQQTPSPGLLHSTAEFLLKG